MIRRLIDVAKVSRRGYCVAFSHNDPQRFIVGMTNGFVSVCDGTTGDTVVYTLTDHSLDVISVAFSPDDSQIVSGSNDGTVRVWKTKVSGGAARDDVHDNSSITSIGFSHNGGIVAFLRSNGSCVVLNMAKGKKDPPRYSMPHGVTFFAYSHKDTSIVCGHGDGTIVIWDVSHGCGRRRGSFHGFPYPKEAIASVAFSYGDHLVLGSCDTIVYIWDSNGSPLRSYQHSARVTSVAFSWDDRRVVFGSNDHTVCIWKLETDQIECKLKGHSDEVTSVAFSQDDSHVVSGSSDGMVLIWNLTTNESTLLSERIPLSDGTRVHSLSNGQFHIYDPVDKMATNNIPPYLLSISPNRDWIVGDQTIPDCWIPRQYRDFTVASVFGSAVCLGYSTDRFVVLDLKFSGEG